MGDEQMLSPGELAIQGCQGRTDLSALPGRAPRNWPPQNKKASTAAEARGRACALPHTVIVY